MATIADIPACTALHHPTPTSSPLPLSNGELTLTVLPANPPSHPSPTVTLSVGASSWPLLPNTPVRKVQAKKEHASYAFNPLPADGGAAIGQVRVVMRDSKSQGEWEATEALCAKFEQALKEQKLWDEKILFVNDEYETSGASGKGWGENLASMVANAGTAAVEKITTYTDKHISHTNPTHPAPPSDAVKAAAYSAEVKTHNLATAAESGAEKVGEAIHEGGKKVGENLPDSIAQKAQPVPEHEKGETRKNLESNWEQAKVAGGGIASAAAAVATAVSESAHRAVEHNFGHEADKVAQDIGQAGANLGSTALSATKATSGIVQGANVSEGLSKTASGKAEGA